MKKPLIINNDTEFIMPDNFAQLLLQNQKYVAIYQTNPLMILIKSEIMRDKKNRQSLLDAIQVFSNYFQKTVMLRSVLTEDNAYLHVAQAHLSEEFGHDIALMHDRGEKLPQWDAILEACSCWFAWKMFTLDNADKTVLVHLVLESSANLFFKEAHRVMSHYGETNYFKIHCDADEHHEAMGFALLKDLRPQDYQHLFEVQRQGWDVLYTACARIADLASA